MHVWNLDHPDSPHEEEALGSKVVRHYTLTDHVSEWKPRQVVHVEAIPRDSWQEVEWVERHAPGVGAVVASVHLEQDGARELLERLSNLRKVRGVRQILNWEAGRPHCCWPFLKEDLTRCETWRTGLALLAPLNLSFDLQCNPAQLVRASAAARIANCRLVVNHLGVPQLDAKTDRDLWMQGLYHVARHHPTASLKVSMLTHLFADHRPWWASAEGREAALGLIHEAIRTFGSHRCMFASNAPVDAAFGLSPTDSMALQDAIASTYDEEGRRSLYAGGAERAYALG